MKYLATILLSTVLVHENGIQLSNKNPVTGEGCCGEGACQVVRGVQHVTLPTPGWRLPNGTFVDEGFALPSNDESFVMCQHGGLITCFFVPRMNY